MALFDSGGDMLINGTNSGETLNGTEGDDQIYGFGGNDIILAGGGNDYIDGGTGNDTLTGGAGNDIFAYSARQFGDDTITDFTSGDRIDLAALNIADLTTLQPFMQQSGQNVVISFGYNSSSETITLNNRTLASLSASDFTFNVSTAGLTVTGTGLRDYLFGGLGNDTISGGAGNDTLSGGSGNDYLDGGTGNDTLTGGAGNDIFAYSARQFGDDTITDFTSGDRIDLAALNIADLTTLQPFMQQSGQNVVISFGYNSSSETITLNNRTLASLSASDFTFNVSTAGLTVTGTGLRDYLFGGLGNDTISGGAGNDTLSGGSGNDYLDGGTNDDTLTGGAGNDIFAYSARQFGDDTITDFTTGDRIDLSALNIADLTTLQPFMQQSGLNVVISFGYNSSSETITLNNRTLASLSASDFTFNVSTAGLTVTGTGLRDYLFGGLGNDTISGGAGDDLLSGGGGNDGLTGGAGNDIFAYYTRQFGDDTIADFTTGDRIDLSAFNIADLTTLQPFMQQSGQNVVISFGYNSASETITLSNRTLASLSAADFIFSASAAALTLTGTSGNDFLFGGLGNDTLSGGSGNDTLSGGGGNDTLTGGAGNDRIDGGSGYDTTLWSGLLHQYTVNPVTVNGSTSFTVSGLEGQDTVANVENYVFLDGRMIVDPDSVGAQVIRLYDAVLGRAPDDNGLDYYLDRIEDRGGTLLGVANDLIGSGEFQAATGSLTNAQFVDYVYQHTLGRAPDANGKAYYTGQLDQGLSRGAMMISFSESAEHRGLTATLVGKGYFNTDDTYQSIALLYDGFAGRLPDAGGLVYYAERVKSGAMTLSQVTNDFAGSTEFRNAIAGKDNGQIVDYIYQNTLHRAPDAGGRAYYVGQLNGGASAGVVLQDVALSAEHYNLFAPHITHGIDIL